jgi:hypothetical protein
MRTKSTINALLTVDDFSLFDTSDINAMILDLLKQNYENICYGGYFIHTVTRVLHRSSIEANQFDTKLSFNINVCMEIDCEHLMPCESIMHLPIIKKTPDAIILKNDNIIALVKIKPSTQSVIETFKLGDTLPVKVGNAITDIGDNFIKVNAVVFTPTPVEAAYKLVSAKERAELTNQIKLLVEMYTQHVQDIQDKMKTSRQDVDKYLDLLWPYKKKSTNAANTLEIKAPNNASKASMRLEQLTAIASAPIQSQVDKIVYMGDSLDQRQRIAGKVAVLDSSPVACVDVGVQEGIIIMLQRENRFLLEIAMAMEVDLIQNTELSQLYVSQKK